MADFEKYQVPFPLDESMEKERTIEITPMIEAAIKEDLKYMEDAIASGMRHQAHPWTNFEESCSKLRRITSTQRTILSLIPEEVENIGVQHLRGISAQCIRRRIDPETTESDGKAICFI